MAAADGLRVAGLALVSYPLHPPGKPDSLRTAHFPRLDFPVLFVSGDRDPFGSPKEFDRETTAIPGTVTLIRLPGAHDIARGNSRVAEAVTRWLATVVPGQEL